MTTKTEEIFQLSAPYNNPYQGPDIKLLFVCSAGLLRSATAANLYAKKGYNTRSCGSAPYALIPISANLIAWADYIIFVNKENDKATYAKFVEHPKFLQEIEQKKVVLDIQDDFAYNNPKLIALLEGLKFE